MVSTNDCPQPSQQTLKSIYVGKRLHEVPLPAAILDRAVIRRNCKQMLDACYALGVSFRPHIKTHKTAEGCRMQVGDETPSVNVVVSTLAEAELLVDYLIDCRKQNRNINVLYGIPLPSSYAERLGRMGKMLGPGSISVLLDHPGQLLAVQKFKESSGFAAEAFIKIDTGYGRAGLQPDSVAARNLMKMVIAAEAEGMCHLHGFYSHSGHSYGVDSADEAMQHLLTEVERLVIAADIADEISDEKGRRYVLSAGATPSATSVENLFTENREDVSQEWQDLAQKLKTCLEETNKLYMVELHAGVYTVNDMQQLATQASPSSTGPSMTKNKQAGLDHSDLAFTILTEVASLYPERSPAEALISAGVLAFGREPCKSYDGWGIVSNWNMGSSPTPAESGWELARISQEHGFLKQMLPRPDNGLHVGQRLRIWPNHACIAGAGFGFYFVVDSDLLEGDGDDVVDVWVRCRGW